ncbi:GAF domain-containing protein [Streptomyces sp. NBC_00366]|uniref:GAF domain-containing protein n=1 Tax=Streptomyces sp. NBC_00366 TaxID=2975727 RepID=UPI002E254858
MFTGKTSRMAWAIFSGSTWWRWEAGTILAGVGTAVAYAFQGWENWPLAASGGICTLMAIVLPVVQARKATAEAKRVNEAAAVEARIAAQTALGNEKRRLSRLLEPLAKELIHLTHAAHRDPADVRRRLKFMVVQTVAPKLADGVRVSFFKLQKHTITPSRVLVCDGISDGRDGHPSTTFPLGEDHGDFMLNYMSNSTNAPLFVANVRNPPPHIKSPPEWLSGACGYETFVAAPVLSKRDLLGMLTLDSERQGALVEEDAETLALIACLLAVGLQAAGRK